VAAGLGVVVPMLCAAADWKCSTGLAQTFQVGRCCEHLLNRCVLLARVGECMFGDPLTCVCWLLVCHVSCVPQGAFDAFAMGNFPFATDYMTGEGQGELPAWPMRAACERMSSMAPSAHSTAQQQPADTNQQAGHAQLGRKGLHDVNDVLTTRPVSAVGTVSGEAGARLVRDTVRQSGSEGVSEGADLLGRLASAASILYNASGTVSCFSLDLAGPAAGSVGK
jgi:hypothetical protein